jgi:hypothetical protein
LSAEALCEGGGWVVALETFGCLPVDRRGRKDGGRREQEGIWCGYGILFEHFSKHPICRMVSTMLYFVKDRKMSVVDDKDASNN